MLTAEEQKFVAYWAANRDKEKKILRQARAGLPFGLSFGAAILICVFSGWYTRAMMELSTDVSPALLIFAVILIAVVYAVFSQRQKWEMNEQNYIMLLAKLKREGGAQSEAGQPSIKEELPSVKKEDPKET